MATFRALNNQQCYYIFKANDYKGCINGSLGALCNYIITINVALKVKNLFFKLEISI